MAITTTSIFVFPLTEGDGVIYHCLFCRAVNREADCVNHEADCLVRWFQKRREEYEDENSY